MSETRAEYLVSGLLPEGPNKKSLLPFFDADYQPPTWEDVRIVMRVKSLSGSNVASLVGVNGRTIRKWTSAPEKANHHQMPYAAWRLLLIAAGYVSSPTLNDVSMYGQYETGVNDGNE